MTQKLFQLLVSLEQTEFSVSVSEREAGVASMLCYRHKQSSARVEWLPDRTRDAKQAPNITTNLFKGQLEWNWVVMKGRLCARHSETVTQWHKSHIWNDPSQNIKNTTWSLSSSSCSHLTLFPLRPSLLPGGLPGSPALQGLFNAVMVAQIQGDQRLCLSLRLQPFTLRCLYLFRPETCECLCCICSSLC